MWDAWVLVVWCALAALAGGARLDSPPDLEPSGLEAAEEGGWPPRRITPKSVFVAPTFCPEGYRADPRGRCVKVVRLNQAAQWEFFLKKLNSMYAAGAAPAQARPPAGPLRLPIPIDSPPPPPPPPPPAPPTTTTTAADTTTTAAAATTPPQPSTTTLFTEPSTTTLDALTTEMSASGEGEMEMEPVEEYEKGSEEEQEESSSLPTPPMMTTTTTRSVEPEEEEEEEVDRGGGGGGGRVVRCKEGIGVSRIEDPERAVDCEESPSSQLRFPYESGEEERRRNRVRFPQDSPPPPPPPPPVFSWPVPVSWEINTYHPHSYQRVNYHHQRRPRPHIYP